MLVQPFEVKEYVRLLAPNKETEGVNVPEDETPAPDHVPPEGEKPVSAKAAAPEQVLMSIPALTVGTDFTVTTTTSVPLQEPELAE